ncbi:Thiol-specific monooxygenase, partial [Choanephora cucurbitarum]
MVLDSFVKKTIKRVAIVGCGPGGLAAARALKNEQCFDTITIFERNNHTGGTWKYSPEKNTPPPFPSVNALEVDNTLREPELHSPIYANLHTNLPHSVMCFHDVPFPEDTPLYPSHAHVMDYLSHVAEQENIVSLVRFRTLVENAEFIDEAWHISVLELETDRRYTEKFDALVVATGHYAVPYIPGLPGLKQISENKSIELVHSREYRQPNEYKNKVVFVIGGGSSANDIVREVATVAKKVYQSIRTPTELSRQSISLNPPNVQQVALVKQFSDGAIQLEDNQT